MKKPSKFHFVGLKMDKKPKKKSVPNIFLEGINTLRGE